MDLSTTYGMLTAAHLATILPAFLIGTYIIIAKKGTKSHKVLGRTYMILMMTTAVITLFMESTFGFSLLGHFGPIHIFSVTVLIGCPRSYFAIKAGRVKEHAIGMITMYVGALVVAGAFTLMPGRFLGDLIFG